MTFQRGGFLARDLKEQIGEGLGFEGQLARQALVEKDADRVDVHPCVDRRGVRHLLGGHVKRTADETAGVGESLAALVKLRDAEVEHLGPPPVDPVGSARERCSQA